MKTYENLMGKLLKICTRKTEQLLHLRNTYFPIFLRLTDDANVWNTICSRFRQLLCPALIQLLGSPLTDLNKRPKSVTPFPEEINRGGRGTGNFAKSSSIVGPIPRTIYNIATELLRLVGPLAAMRPVLESLFHRIILYPPAQQRTEALKALKEVQWVSWDD